MRLLTAAAAALLASCSADPQLEPAPGPEAAVAQPIIGGTLDTGDPSVVMLYADGGTNNSSVCTGSVISKHVVLTAAHCVLPAAGTTPKYYVFLGSDVNDKVQAATASNWLDVLETHYDPAFDINNLQNGHDVAVAIVRATLTSPPLSMNRTNISSGYVGQNLRLVGYGITSPTASGTSGTKRQTNTPLSQVTSLFVSGGTSTHSTCHGDSGGPAFMTIGGKEVIAGITSFGWSGSGTQDCTDTAFTRVDTVATQFADPYVALWDGGGRNTVCPSSGTATVCYSSASAPSSGMLAHCSNGAVTAWDDCTAMNAWCSSAGATLNTARCVSKSCAATATTAPVASTTCGAQPGTITKCDANGQLTTQTCPSGQQCSTVGGAHCVKAVCPATGTSLACADAQTIAECTSGAITKTTACGATEWCSTAGGQVAHCLSQECVASADTAPVAHATCLADGRFARCDAKGLLGVVSECAAGAYCVKSSAGASCIAGAPDAGAAEPPDAGAASNPSPATPAAQEPSKCGCGAAGGALPGFGFALVAFGLLGLRRRRLC